MEKHEIAFHEISCGVPHDTYDLIIKYKSAKEIWDILKNMYEEIEQAQDKKLTTTPNDFKNFKALPRESVGGSFKRFNLIVTRLSNTGVVRGNHETNLHFLNGFGRQWMMEKMIVQGDNKIKALSLCKHYGELQA